MSEWFDLFTHEVEGKSIEGMVRALNTQSTKHAGTAPAKIKNKAISYLRKETSETRYRLIRLLCDHDHPTAKEIGAITITDYYKQHPSEIEVALFSLASDNNWEVREWAASACGILLENHFNGFLPTLSKWTKLDSANHRRASILAMMYAGKTRKQEWVDPFLDLIEPLLYDRSQYVKDNLGPFAIGSALIKYYPNQVLARLKEWAKIEDEQVLWNLAMVFSAAEGAKHAVQAQPILERLSQDNRPYVKKAFVKAQKMIKKGTGVNLNLG